MRIEHGNSGGIILINTLIYFLMFLGGAALLVYSVEKFVGNLVKTASVYGLSTFLLAVVFAGMDFENWGFGISAVLKEVPDIALGSAIGSAMFLIGAALVVGGLITPFTSKTPRDYLAIMISSPLVLFLFLADGSLARIDGIALILIFSIILFYIIRKETATEREYLRDEEVEEVLEEKLERKKNWLYPVLMIIFLFGIIIGSEFSVRGARELVTALHLSGTVFGMTVVGLVMSLEEILLVVEPVREGEINVATGNIVGSLIFFSLGNVGILAIIKGFSIADSVLSFYWPFLFASVLLVGIFLERGKIGKIEATILAGIYSMYWILSYFYL